MTISPLAALLKASMDGLMTCSASAAPAYVCKRHLMAVFLAVETAGASTPSFLAQPVTAAAEVAAAASAAFFRNDRRCIAFSSRSRWADLEPGNDTVSSCLVMGPCSHRNVARFLHGPEGSINANNL